MPINVNLYVLCLLYYLWALIWSYRVQYTPCTIHLSVHTLNTMFNLNHSPSGWSGIKPSFLTVSWLIRVSILSVSALSVDVAAARFCSTCSAASLQKTVAKCFSCSDDGRLSVSDRDTRDRTQTVPYMLIAASAIRYNKNCSSEKMIQDEDNK